MDDFEPIQRSIVGRDSGGNHNAAEVESGALRVAGALDFVADIEVREVGYQISDKDDDASPNYYGFLDASGAWYIMKETILAGNDSYRYVKGDSGYSTAWTNRVSQSYDYYDVVF